MRIDDAAIGSPCDEPDENMRMDGIDRFCDRCEKTVYDLSARTEAEARALLARPGKLCIRYRVRKATGELLFAGALMTAGIGTAPAFAAGDVPTLLAAQVTEISSEAATPDPLAAPADVDGGTPPCAMPADPNATPALVAPTEDGEPVEPEPTVIYKGGKG